MLLSCRFLVQSDQLNRHTCRINLREFARWPTTYKLNGQSQPTSQSGGVGDEYRSKSRGLNLFTVDKAPERCFQPRTTQSARSHRVFVCQPHKSSVYHRLDLLVALVRLIHYFQPTSRTVIIDMSSRLTDFHRVFRPPLRTDHLFHVAAALLRAVLPNISSVALTQTSLDPVLSRTTPPATC